ncbi:MULTISPECIES: glucose-1-phosphate adenylyltransferase [Aliiglaciecola]|uniref:glucose-1-phosphate adenylyltransferase n=1 Tax=Aliiglaciecola TaxID=1406885 RepID=UPI001C09F016|nr:MULTISPECIES: glucose-1-phosphate adenylyltransferase [Aliiglaciecola]MBU2876340.1 glucose-1-phosphate adenylyltransferase [Aliiglaciecola lipolytica]MDO6710556.1 glucose-1-phosphate adenylyltransferase [Aliiglaciecola sp. 2_MG-2023]MDO6751579.1 glucose-1-phosphate adenylyltransferase [Aliiglaciecola sp. 1_MG-2023]
MVISNSRYVSHLTRDTLALVLAGGKGSRLCELTQHQAKPAVHFGGKFRIIDFPLSNCVNSGIRKIGVMTQYKAYSLLRHLARGWGHLNRDLGEFVELLPASQQYSSSWYAGTADALYQNIRFIRENAPKYVVVLSGDHIYKMDYGDMLAQHAQSGADMTISCIEMPIEEAAGKFGVMSVDQNSRITEFQEKPINPWVMKNKPGSTLASMGNYVFSTEFLIEKLIEDAKNNESQHDFGHDIIPNVIKNNHVEAFVFRSENPNEATYWRDVGTLDSFWQANMDLVTATPDIDLYDKDWPIWTYQKQSPPAKFIYDEEKQSGYAVNSNVSGGCIISGAIVKQSLLFSDVHIENNSFVEDSVILPHVKIGKNVKIYRAVIDADCEIPDGFEIGIDTKLDKARGFRISQGGVVLVTSDMLSELNKVEIYEQNNQHKRLRA